MDTNGANVVAVELPRAAAGEFGDRLGPAIETAFAHAEGLSDHLVITTDLGRGTCGE